MADCFRAAGDCSRDGERSADVERFPVAERSSGDGRSLGGCSLDAERSAAEERYPVAGHSSPVAGHSLGEAHSVA